MSIWFGQGDKTIRVRDTIYIGDRLAQVKINKSAGPDGVHPYVLKQCALSLSFPICLLGKKSVELGIVPVQWKFANITPVFKSGSKLIPTNYRGISLTSVLCKFIERIIADHIMSYLLRFNLISRHQHGFMSKLSTVTNLLQYIDIISGALDKKYSIDVIYLDFAKAFDRVPHSRMVLKLKSIGITGSLLVWCESFLSNRKQRVVMGEHIGEWKDILSGVPQGSVLGPLFFLIYLNDLLGLLTIPSEAYADDSKLISININGDQHLLLQENLNKIYFWTLIWLLFLNEDKCKVLHLGNTEQLKDKKEYYINGVQLSETLVEKDLGILVTSDLDWEKQIVKSCSTTTFVSKLIFKTFKYKSVEIIRMIYKSLIRPKLEYANVIWSPIKKAHIQMLEKVQRRCTKYGPLFKLNYEDRLIQLGLTSLETRRKRGDVIQMFKYVKGIDRINFVNPPVFLKTSTRGHQFKYHREDLNCKSHKSRSNYFLNRVWSDWNRLPEKALEVTTVNEFKNYIDKLEQFSVKSKLVRK